MREEVNNQFLVSSILVLVNEICEMGQFNLVINWFGLVITTAVIGIIVLSSVEWEAGLHAVSDRLCHRSRQRLEISLPLLQKWRR